MTVQKTKTLVGGLLLVLCTALLPAAFLTTGAAALRPLLALGLALALWCMDALPAPVPPCETSSFVFNLSGQPKVTVLSAPAATPKPTAFPPFFTCMM